MSERRVFTDAFKREAVCLAKERGNTSAVARDLGIHESLLSQWKQRLEVAPERPFPGKGNPQDLELAQMKRELARLKEENEILKAAVGIFTVRPQGDTRSYSSTQGSSRFVRCVGRCRFPKAATQTGTSASPPAVPLRSSNC